MEDHDSIAGLARFFAEYDIALFNPASLPTAVKVEHKRLAAGIAMESDTVAAFLRDMITNAKEDGRVMRKDDNVWNPRTQQPFPHGEYVPLKLHEEYLDFVYKRLRRTEPLSSPVFLKRMRALVGESCSMKWQGKESGDRWRSYHINIASAGDELARALGCSSWDELHNIEDEGPETGDE
jgi:hypothetical protein